MSLPFVAKPKACAQCGSLFSPFSSTARVCSPTCARKIIKADRAYTKVQTKARKAELETIPELIKKAQVAFNAYRRECDKLAGYPCISCSRPLNWGGDGRGHQVDCGHYRSRGSAPHLRFDERNAHAQCVNCNRYGAGRAVDYRIGLVGRIGEGSVQALEANNTPHKWQREELREIRATYTAKLKALKENQ